MINTARQSRAFFFLQPDRTLTIAVGRECRRSERRPWSVSQVRRVDIVIRAHSTPPASIEEAFQISPSPALTMSSCCGQ